MGGTEAIGSPSVTMETASIEASNMVHAPAEASTVNTIGEHGMVFPESLHNSSALFPQDVEGSAAPTLVVRRPYSEPADKVPSNREAASASGITADDEPCNREVSSMSNTKRQ